MKLLEDEISVEKREPVDDSIEDTVNTEVEIPKLDNLVTVTKKLKLLKADVVVEKAEPIDDSIDETESLEKDLDDIAQGYIYQL